MKLKEWKDKFLGWEKKKQVYVSVGCVVLLLIIIDIVAR